MRATATARIVVGERIRLAAPGPDGKVASAGVQRSRIIRATVGAPRTELRLVEFQ
jgi:hypothetical protein